MTLVIHQNHSTQYFHRFNNRQTVKTKKSEAANGLPEDSHVSLAKQAYIRLSSGVKTGLWTRLSIILVFPK